MNTRINRPLPRRLLGLAYAVLAVLALAFTLTPARAADFVLTNSDAINFSSFNSAGQWNPNVAPVSALPADTNNYYAINNLLTPTNATPFTFAGDVLYLGYTNVQVSLSIKGPGLITVSNLVADGGGMTNLPFSDTNSVNNGYCIIQNAGTGVLPNIARIAGNITVLTNVMMKSGGTNATLAITALLHGTNGNTLSFIDRGGTNLLSGNQPYTGSIVESGVQVVMDSTLSMTPSSLTVGQNAQVVDLVNTNQIYNTTNTVAAGGNLNVGNGAVGTVFQVGMRSISNPQKTNDPVSALLDVSKQSSFTVNVASVNMGHQGAGGSTCVGTLLLATNNYITASGSIRIGESTSTGNGASLPSTVVLGAGTNVIDTPTLTFGGFKSKGNMWLTNGGLLVLTNSTVTGPGVNWNIARSFGGGTSGNGLGTNDLSGGTVIATVNNLIIGQKNHSILDSGLGGATGVLILSTNAANLVTANEIDVGYMAQNTTTATATGIMTMGGGNVLVNNVVLGWWDFGVGGKSFGTLNLNGGNFIVSNNIVQWYSGTLNVNGGLLYMANNGSITASNITVNSTITNASAITVANLNGSGAIVGSGTTTVSGVFNPGLTNNAGTLTANNVTFGPSAVLNYNLGSTTAVGGSANDLLVVNGDLDLGNATLKIINGINTGPGGIATGTYTLATFTGNVFGSLIPAPSHYTVTITTNTAASPKEINLTVSGSPYDLVWNGVNSSLWDINTTPNWTNQLNNPDVYVDLDKVRFDDKATNPLVYVAAAVMPNNVIFSNNTVAYRLTSTNGSKIIGGTGLTKQGTGSLIITNANDFTGPVNLLGGLVKVGNIAALGATNGMVTIASGATLDVNFIALGQKPVTVQGAGWDGLGAIVNNNASSSGTRGFQYVTLSGNTTFGGTNRWDVYGTTATGSGFLNGGSYSLTKVGVNNFLFSGGVVVNCGTIAVNEGMLTISTATTINAGYPITVTAPGILQLGGVFTPPLPRDINLGNGATLQGGTSAAGGQVDGSVTLNTVGYFSLANLNLFGPVTGTGDLVTITNGASTTQSAVVKLCSTNNNWTGRLVIVTNATVWVGNDTTAAGNLPATVTVTNLAGGTLRWSPPTNNIETWASDVSGPGTVTKQGGGTLVVNNANTWTGPFTAGTAGASTVNGGIIRLLNNNGFGDGIVAKTAGIFRSELRLEGGITIPAGISFQVGGNYIDHGLMPIRNIAGNNTVAGSMEVIGGMGAAEIASDAGLLQLNGPMFTAAAGRIFRFSGAGNGVVNGVITNGANALSVVMNGPGLWTFTATNTYTGTTTVSGGKLLVNGAIGAGAVTVATNGTFGGTGTIGGAVTYNNGAHAVLTLGSNLTFSSSLIVSNGADVHLILSNNVPAGNYTLATYNVTGSSGAFSNTPVIDSGSLAGANTGTIVTSGGIVQLQVAASAPATPPNFPAGGVSVLPGGGISLVATGALGGTYRLWATTNLALTPVTNTWTLLNSGTITTSPFTNTDLTATNYPQRFYLFSNP